MSEGPVGAGDAIQCNYIGWYADYTLFDTSVYALAVDDALYPKSSEFNCRGDESAYSTLAVTLGTGGVISGFDAALTGMRVGETNVVRLTSEEGYNDGKVRVFEVELVSM